MQMCIRGPKPKAFTWILKSKRLVVLFRSIKLRVEYWFDVFYETHRINSSLCPTIRSCLFCLNCLFLLFEHNITSSFLLQ